MSARCGCRWRARCNRCCCRYRCTCCNRRSRCDWCASCHQHKAVVQFPSGIAAVVIASCQLDRCGCNAHFVFVLYAVVILVIPDVAFNGRGFDRSQTAVIIRVVLCLDNVIGIVPHVPVVEVVAAGRFCQYHYFVCIFIQM